MKILEKYGLMLNHQSKDENPTGNWYMENQFFQLVNNPRMISAIKNAIINANLARAEIALNSKDTEERKDLLSRGLPEAIFNSTKYDVWSYYASTAPGQSIKVRPDIVKQGTEFDSWVDYEPEQHGYAPLGNYSQFMRHWQVDVNGEKFSRCEVMKYSVFVCHAQGRNVDVRHGNIHGPDSILIDRPPSDGERYRVQYWK
jgi:hypothetical protein